MAEFPLTRWSLIARLPDQPQQIGTVVGLYADAIGAYLRQKLSSEHPDRLDDLIQEVLVDLLGKPEVLAAAQPGAGSRFRYYLMSLAWGSARNALRRARRGDHAPLNDLEDHLEAAAEQVAMDRSWARSVLQQALDEVRRWSADGTLDPGSDVILKAHLIEGRGLREIGQDLSLSAATCSRRLARARQLLQSAITERLRLAGDLGPGDDPARACALLLDSLASG